MGGSEWILGRLAGGGLDLTDSGWGPVTNCCECGDQLSGSCATELVTKQSIKFTLLLLEVFMVTESNKVLLEGGGDCLRKLQCIQTSVQSTSSSDTICSVCEYMTADQRKLYRLRFIQLHTKWNT
jgi:hypothetical protein